jgi:ABC-type transport system involved in multi-copper enzyme maturation permease subunit
MPDLRLISADILKLRRRRGMLAIALLCTLGITILAFAVAALQHSGNPIRYQPAGGLKSYQDALEVIGLLMLVAGSIIGATAGTQDVESGVFRDLAATGRSRMALFASRIVGACAVSVPIAAVTAAFAGGACVAFAGDATKVDAGALASGSALLIGAMAFSTIVAVGISALVGSRGPVIGILLGFFLAIQPVLVALGFLGGLRDLVPSAALHRIGDMPDPPVAMGIGTAIAALVLWSLVAAGAGAWRTRTSEL